jgi:hypothetical protein
MHAAQPISSAFPATSRRRHLAPAARSASRSGLEPLEARTLLSATWTTANSPPNGFNHISCLTSDAAGDIYAIGDIVNAGGQDVNVIREKPAGGASWSAPALLPPNISAFTGMAVDGSGNVFTCATASGTRHWGTWEIPHAVGKPVQIDDGGVGKAQALATDGAGNLYVAGQQPVATNGAWTVRKGVFNRSTGIWSFTSIKQTTTVAKPLCVGVVTTTVQGVASTTIYAVGRVGTAFSHLDLIVNVRTAPKRR